MCKFCHKVRNNQKLSHESPNFGKYFFLSNFTGNFGNFSTNLRPHYQTSFFQIIFLCSSIHSRMSGNMCIWRHKLCNAKQGFGPTFTWSNEAWLKEAPVQWWANIKNGHKQISKYIRMAHYVPNKYSNIYGCHICTERISEYICMPEIARIRIQVIFKGHFIRIFTYSYSSLIEEIFEMLYWILFYA